MAPMAHRIRSLGLPPVKKHKKQQQKNDLLTRA